MNENPKTVTGVLPVFQTPFHLDESIDFETLAREIDWLFNEGADGIVLAMVSEVLRLSDHERHALTEEACELANGRGAAIISVGAESSRQAEAFAKQAESAGATALMAIPPVAIGATPDELGGYYERLFKAVEIPIVVQDASGYVGLPMSIEFQAGLLDAFGADRVWFKPEAVPIGPRLSALRDATNSRARIFEGTGGISLVDSYERGICGTMPGADLIRGIVPLWEALEKGDMTRASRIHGPLSSLISMQTSLDGFLAVEKHLLVRQGIFSNELVRGPRGFVIDEETRNEVDRLFDLMIEATLED
ncbi:dihydrodipicolinate synthase family protein [Verrucomicrobiales bacterium BCK34]|nr:dihydrodipicolinate synthase family protein [Verrucomicrobiales bacterium BCK34]